MNLLNEQVRPLKNHTMHGIKKNNYPECLIDFFKNLFDID